MSVFFTNRKKFFQIFQKDRRLPSEFCTSRRLSYAPMAGFPLCSNKAVKGEVILTNKELESSKYSLRKSVFWNTHRCSVNGSLTLELRRCTVLAEQAWFWRNTSWPLNLEKSGQLVQSLCSDLLGGH